MSSQGSRSPSSSRGGRNGERSPSPKRENKPYKLYVTNLDTKCDETKLKDELEQLFSKYGQIASIVLKLSFNKEYRYAFVDYKEGEDATEALDKLNGVIVSDKPMKVEEQDNSRRRKATSGGDCYKCGKPGHFARQCRSERMDDRDRRRRSRSRSKDRKKKKSHRHRSESSESAHAKKKDKKKHKSHKKHKKSKKKHYSSDSESSD